MLTVDKLYHPTRAIEYAAEPPIDRIGWLPRGDRYLVHHDGAYVVVDAATAAEAPWEEGENLEQALASLPDFTREQARRAVRPEFFSGDMRLALVAHENDLYLYTASTADVKRLTHSPEKEEELARLSPTGDHVAFVQDHDLWLVDCQSGELRRVTSDGSPNVLNGILDWVYQEELYGRGNFQGFWWSPDGSRIAFLRLDEEAVPQYLVPNSLPISQQLESTRYPKAGQPLPQVVVRVADVSSGDISDIPLAGFPAEDRLVGRVTWAPDGTLWIQVLNRVQNRQALLRASPDGRAVTAVVIEESPGWIEIRGTPHFLPQGDFLWLSDLPHGRTHLFRVNPTSGTKGALTAGDWDVVEFISLSEDGQTAFVVTNASGPTGRQLLAVDTETGDQRPLTTTAGVHACQVAPSGRFFIDRFSTMEQPPVLAVHNAEGKMLHIAAAPTDDRYQALKIAPARPIRIDGPDGVELSALVLLPDAFVSGHPSHRLPVLFYVYGGPQAPATLNRWNGRFYWWHQFLCQQGFAVVLCDNRSSLGRGIKDSWSIRKRFGKIELMDLHAVVDWVKKQPWADGERLGVWGWSFGGYLTAYALTHSPDVFRCGMAGAPVTDWRNYDAIYTERYMDLPQHNKEGYAASSVVAAAAMLSGRLLLVHGERDDNVHLSNTLQLAHALQHAQKQFDLMVYPGNRHSITDPPQRYHLMRLMTDFLHRQLLTGNAQP
ncbi:MAG: peptidase S9 [Pirellulaceae bacterium]|nr:MAG: peptidase S9 [Pirellulaceae bacterium]